MSRKPTTDPKENPPTANDGVVEDSSRGIPETDTFEEGRLIDDRLIDASLAGDSLAYGQLVTRYQDRLRNTLRNLTGSTEEAEDVAQEAFVQAYLKLDSFQRTAQFFTWLYRIAFNLAVSRNRKKRPRVSFTAAQEAGAPDPVAEGYAPDAATLADERSALLHEAVAKLPEDYRQVLVLREFEGCDYQRIAEVLELPIGTVRSRLFRARAQLRERLAPIFDEGPREEESN